MATSFFNPDIITGQFVYIAQTPASIADRIIARIIDYIVLTVYVISVWVLFNTIDNILTFSPYRIELLFIVLPVVFYSLICEVFFDGRSIGKYVMGTRVVMADGSQPGIGASLLRWCLIPIDIYFSCIGIIFILCSKKRQRIGDMAAGTMVIKQPDTKKMKLSLIEFDYASRNYCPVYKEAQYLSMAQAEVIKKTLDNADKQGNKHIDLLAMKIAKLFDICPKENNNKIFLQTLLNDYQFYATELV